MSPDEHQKPTDEERRQLLEQIRRRAEEAELRRIEDEEQELPERPTKDSDQSAQGLPLMAQGESSDNVRTPAGQPPSAEEVAGSSAGGEFPAAAKNAESPPAAVPPPMVPPPAPGFVPPHDDVPVSVPVMDVSPAQEVRPVFTGTTPDGDAANLVLPESMDQFLERISTLRDEYYNAMEQGELRVARKCLDGLTALTPDDAGLDTMRHRLEVMEGRNRSLPVEPDEMPGPPPVPPGAVDREQIKELLERADNHYQREHYTSALEMLDTVSSLDPENDEARRLRRLVERSRDLSAKIAEEDTRTDMLADTPGGAPFRDEADELRDAGLGEKPADPLTLVGTTEQQGPMAPPKPGIAARSRNLVTPVVSLLLACAVLGGGYALIRKLKATVAPSHPSLLVLPAIPRDGDPATAQLAEGLTDDVIHKLSAIANLRVLPSYTAFKAASTFSPLQAARNSRAGMYLRWTMAASGSSLTIEMAAYDTVAASAQWTRKFIVSLQGFPVQRSELLAELVEATGVRASEEEQVMLHSIPTASGDAYEAYLRGRALLLRPDPGAPLLAVGLFEHAVRDDSLFAEAYAALGWAHILAGEAGDISMDHAFAASVSSKRALGLGLKNSEALRLCGAVNQEQRQYDKAVERFEQAAVVAPTDAEATRRLALLLVMRAQTDRALAAAQRSVRDDPANPASYTALGLIQQYMAVAAGDRKDDYAAALLTFHAGERLAPDRGAYVSRYLPNVQLYAQQPEEALAILTDETAQNRQNYESLYRLGRMQQAAGRPIPEWQEVLARARSVINERLTLNPGDPVLLSWLALVQTRLGAFREAQTAVTQALRQGAKIPSVLYNAARVYALQRDARQSLDNLRMAVLQKYDLAAVLDMDLFNLHGNPDFQTSVTL